MKTMNKILTAAAALSMLAGCQKNEVKIHADFTTDKDVYELYEDIRLTNTSYAENAYVMASKWEWDAIRYGDTSLRSPFLSTRRENMKSG